MEDEVLNYLNNCICLMHHIKNPKLNSMEANIFSLVNKHTKPFTY